MLAVAKAKYLDVIHFDRSPRWRDVPHGAMKNTVVRASERFFLDGDIGDDVSGLDTNTTIREGCEPTAEERGTSRLSLALDSAWRPKDDILCQDFRKPVDVVGVEGGCPSF